MTLQHLLGDPNALDLEALHDATCAEEEDLRRELNEYRDLFRDAVHMMAHIARAAGFDPEDPTVEPPAIVARVERLRTQRDELCRLLRQELGVVDDDGRRNTPLLSLTPHLMGRIEAIGFVPGECGVLPWLVGEAEDERKRAAMHAALNRRCAAALVEGTPFEIARKVLNTQLPAPTN